MKSRLRVACRKLFRVMTCFLFGHDWRMSPAGRRRACRHCLRREVLFFAGYSFGGRWHEEWIEHTHPIDADPSMDPTVVSVDGYSYTLGQLHRDRIAIYGAIPVQSPCRF